MKNSKLSKGFKQMASNSGYLIFEKVLNLGVAFLVSIYVIRYLGAEDLGLLEYSISAVALFLPLGRIGTTHLVIRDLVESAPGIQNKIIGTVFRMLLITSFIVIFLTIFIFWQIESDSKVRILIILASFSLFLQVFDVFDYWFQANVLSKYSVISRIGFQLASSLAKVAFIYFGLSVTYFGFSIVIGGMVQIIGLYYFYTKLNKSIHWTFSREYAMGLLKKSWPLLISGISLAVYMRIDVLMLKNMVDANAVGNYSVAVKLSELWYFIPMALISSLFPNIIKVRKQSIQKYNERMRYLYEILILIALAIAIPMTLLSKSLVLLLFGKEFIEASIVLSVHIWAGIFVFIGVARSKWLVNENLQFYGMIFNIIGAIINIGLNLILIREFQILGAAIATLIAQIFSAWLLAVFFKKTRMSFIVQAKAILAVITIYPLVKSFKSIFTEIKA